MVKNELKVCDKNSCDRKAEKVLQSRTTGIKYKICTQCYITWKHFEGL